MRGRKKDTNSWRRKGHGHGDASQTILQKADSVSSHGREGRGQTRGPCICSDTLNQTHRLCFKIASESLFPNPYNLQSALWVYCSSLGHASIICVAL